jgi:hypothetical protein
MVSRSSAGGEDVKVVQSWRVLRGRASFLENCSKLAISSLQERAG